MEEKCVKNIDLTKFYFKTEYVIGFQIKNSLFIDSEKPAAFNYLLEAENVLLTPHIAGWTYESHEKLAQTIVNKIKAIY